MFKVMKTNDLQQDGPTKTLLYAHHGWGKTYQTRYYQKAFGKGLILSGEAGLKSVEDVDIDYLPFSSWDKEHDPENGVYSFKGISKMMMSQDFKKQNYKWIGLDSLTELSERLLEQLENEAEGGNSWQLWGDYSRHLLGALKWFRDMPVHVYVSCLAKEEKDPNDVTHYWPLVKGNAVAKHVPAIFDHVMCGVRVTEKSDNGHPRVRRYIVTDEISGWHGKARDPRNTLKAFEECDNVTELLAKMASGSENKEEK